MLPNNQKYIKLECWDEDLKLAVHDMVGTFKIPIKRLIDDKQGIYGPYWGNLYGPPLTEFDPNILSKIGLYKKVDQYDAKYA